jgi:hypothetical protein
MWRIVGRDGDDPAAFTTEVPRGASSALRSHRKPVLDGGHAPRGDGQEFTNPSG